jgi:hypothetical protein
MPDDTAPASPERHTDDPERLAAAVAAAKAAVRETRRMSSRTEAAVDHASAVRRFAAEVREATRAARDHAQLLRLEHRHAAGHRVVFKGFWQGYRYTVELEHKQRYAEDPWHWCLSYRERTFDFRANELGGDEAGIRAGVEAFLGFLVPGPGSGHSSKAPQ